MSEGRASVPPPAGRRILVVEDNPADVDLIRIALAEESATEFVVEHATRISDALKLLERTTYEVVLLDLGLPDAEGLSGLAKIAPACRRTPIVVLTGSTDKATGMAALDRGAQSYAVKGWLDSAALVKTIREAIGRRRIQGELAALGEDLRAAGARLSKLGTAEKKRR